MTTTSTATTPWEPSMTTTSTATTAWEPSMTTTSTATTPWEPSMTTNTATTPWEPSMTTNTATTPWEPSMTTNTATTPWEPSMTTNTATTPWEPSMTTNTATTGSFASLRAEFIFKRRVSFFITATYMPAIVLVILSWCTFWIHRNAVPARVTLSITTILTTILLTGTVNASMPKVSYSKAIDYFMMTSLGFIFMSLLEYILVLNTHPNIRKEKEEEEEEEDDVAIDLLLPSSTSGKDLTPDTIVTMMDKTTNGRQSTTSKMKTCLTPKSAKYAKDKKDLPYLDVHWIDRSARVLFPICYFTFVIAYWIYYINHPLTDFELF
ncbi:hypothetical protein QZH41_009090 [Actinostola sp. cb2023]|nr:hypothetical protein QZH41_009090 [Actinostola sp. cb2023]